jgi:hypothetical protein
MKNKILIFTLVALLVGSIFLVSTSENLLSFQGSMFKASQGGPVDGVEKNNNARTVRSLNCSDSDGGMNYRQAGNVTLYDSRSRTTLKSDKCKSDGIRLQEYVCMDNRYKGDQTFDCSRLGTNYICEEGACIQNLYTIYNTTNTAEGFGFIDRNPSVYKEEALPVVAVVRDNVKVLVPRGYELLAKAHIEDLLTCQPLLTNFYGGIEFPEDEVVMKIYVSSDDSNLGSSAFGKIMYRRSQENIDYDLETVITNNPEGFLYNSSADYCANSHELTHAYFNRAPLPNWGNEGLAQFTQKNNQGDIFDHIDCQAEGYFSYGEWNVYSDMSTDSVLDYNTAMCFVEELVETYGWTDFYAMLAQLNRFQTGELVWDSFGPYHFVIDVLEYVYGAEVFDILNKYGIEEVDYAA